MRITKEFARSCANIATRQAKDAYSTSQAMLMDFLRDDKQATALLTTLFPPEVFALQKLYEKQADELEESIGKLSGGVINEQLQAHLYEKLGNLNNSRHRTHPFGTRDTFANNDYLSVSMRLHLPVESAPKNGQPASSFMTIAGYKLFNTAALKGRYQHLVCEMACIMSGSDWSAEVTVDIDASKTFDQESQEALMNIINTGEKLRSLVNEMESQYYIVENFTTLAHLQNNGHVWPLVKDSDYVTRWIREKKQAEIEAKEAKEEKLRIERERAAQKRLDRLAAIEAAKKAGTLIEPEPVETTVDTSLISAMNRMTALKKGRDDD